jgi:adenine-specific DNA glycosylase
LNNSSQSEAEIEYLLVQRPETGLLASLWEFPSIELHHSNDTTTKGTDQNIQSQNTTTKHNLQYDKWKPLMDQYLKERLGLNFIGIISNAIKVFLITTISSYIERRDY